MLVVLGLSIAANAQWLKQNVNTTASFRGLSVVNEKIVWASGTGGTVIRTTDGGKTWKVMTVTGGEKLDFRDIEAFDANTAYILSIGNGENSRIYKTTDGGATWKLQLKAQSEKAFFDALACWDVRGCALMSDPVDGEFLVYVTEDGTETWHNTRSYGNRKMPPALEGEAAFAASGTCLTTIPGGKGTLLLVSGGSAARVFRSKSRGLFDWSVSETKFPKGTQGSGIFSIAMFDSKNGVIVGGDYEKPAEAINNLAFTKDAGRSWTPRTGLTGYRSAVAYIENRKIIAVGTNGTDLTTDGGGVWKKIGDENLNAVAAKGRDAVWAVGPSGLVAKLRL
jgi:photosystem II stability/assembly factor-like uncharacterized protein